MYAACVHPRMLIKAGFARQATWFHSIPCCTLQIGTNPYQRESIAMNRPFLHSYVPQFSTLHQHDPASAPPARIIRSLLFIRANVESLKKVLPIQPDAIVFDMEDAIPHANKASHRRKTAEVLSELPRILESFQASHATRPPVVCLRVNSLDDMPLLEEDLHVLVGGMRHPALDALVLPKIRSLRDVQTFESLTAAAENAAGVQPSRRMKFIPIIETAAAIGNVFEIASSPRNTALIFGHADLLEDLQATDSPQVLQHFRSVVVAAARANGINPIDSAFLHLKDVVAYQHECTQGKQMGFSGKVVLHPALVPMTNMSFLPQKREVKWAQKVLAKAEHSHGSGSGGWLDASGKPQGIFMVDGAVAGPPAISTAQKIMSIIRNCAAEELFTPDAGVPPHVVRPLGGIDLSSVHPGQVIHSKLQITLTEAFKTLWMFSFLETSPLLSSHRAASALLGTDTSPVPSPALLMLVVAMSVMRFSENAIVHLSLKNIRHTRLVFPGDTLYNSMQVLSVRSTADGKASIIVSKHVLKNQHDQEVFSAVKTTMFPPHLRPGQVMEMPEARSISTPVKEEPHAVCSWLADLKPAGLVHVKPDLPLKAGNTIIHRLVKIFGPEEHRGLVNLVRVTNAHHINTMQFGPSELLIAGPFSIAGILSCAYVDLGPILAEVVHQVASINKVNAGDVLSACTHIISRRDMAERPDLEVVEAVILGLKNVDQAELAMCTIPEKLLHDVGGDIKPAEVEDSCRKEAPLLYHKVVARLHVSLVRAK